MEKPKNVNVNVKSKINLKLLQIIATSYFEEAISTIVFHDAIPSVNNHSTGFDSYCPLTELPI